MLRRLPFRWFLPALTPLPCRLVSASRSLLQQCSSQPVTQLKSRGELADCRCCHCCRRMLGLPPSVVAITLLLESVQTACGTAQRAQYSSNVRCDLAPNGTAEILTAERNEKERERLLRLLPHQSASIVALQQHTEQSRTEQRNTAQKNNASTATTKKEKK